MVTRAAPSRVFAAYAVLCVVWGSTFIAIRIGVRHFAPALFGASRYLVAGAVLLTLALALGRRLPRRAEDWRTNIIVGLLLLFCANGLVIWSEQSVPSGVAAIFIATVALWIALFDAVIPGGDARPTWTQAVGLLLGFGGTLIVAGADVGGLGHTDWHGPLALTTAAASWGLGSVYAKRHPTEAAPEISSALQMLVGGLAFVVAATLSHEWTTVRPTAAGLGAVAYLVVFGSLVGYSCFVYVLRHMPPTVAGTYVYVNTVVAVLLGWLLLGEQLTARTVGAMAVVVGSVIWVRRAGRRRPVRAPRTSTT